MKFLVIFALAAVVAAEPEADAATVFTNGQFHTNAENLAKGIHTQHAGPVGQLYNTHYTPYMQQPIVPYYQKPVVYQAQPAMYSNMYQSPLIHSLFKREAEAESESEAEPLTIYRNNYMNTPLAYTNKMYSPLSYAHGVAAPSVYTHASAVPTYSHSAAGVPLTYTSGVHHAAYNPYYQTASPIYRHLYKRDAEAEPEAEAAKFYHNLNVPNRYSGMRYQNSMIYQTPQVHHTPVVYNAHKVNAFSPVTYNNLRSPMIHQTPMAYNQYASYPQQYFH